MKKNILLILSICFICLACQTEEFENQGKDLLEKNSAQEGACETSFAIGNSDIDHNCFSEGGFNRWGWSIGPISEGSYSYDFYSGAGQCSIDKGVLVGTVTIEYINGSITAEYDLIDGYINSETHLYAGSTIYPTKRNGKYTVAPGQYYVEDNLSGDIYVIAHAVTCEDTGDDDGDDNGEPAAY